ncbi:hypothetical protein DSCO28_73570 (plasmid) [Desulfosarcina ovata subsp. sediminis]|uniref:Uncharacterized protein n=1 Tax=Desulfosarcina ovata subsp. sediminis TaxID=885957 RepID=A0A5K8A2X5_9BACT|nr:hypothetical protein DSCO28_73570 [Desulfosarcina ovata subsp. sediminis]
MAKAVSGSIAGGFCIEENEHVNSILYFSGFEIIRSIVFHRIHLPGYRNHFEYRVNLALKDILAPIDVMDS